jgi:hypothetical protein
LLQRFLARGACFGQLVSQLFDALFHARHFHLDSLKGEFFPPFNALSNGENRRE